MRGLGTPGGWGPLAARINLHFERCKWARDRDIEAYVRPGHVPAAYAPQSFRACRTHRAKGTTAQADQLPIVSASKFQPLRPDLKRPMHWSAQRCCRGRALLSAKA